MLKETDGIRILFQLHEDSSNALPLPENICRDMPNPMIKCPRCGEAAPEIDELIIGVCSWLYQHGIFTMFSCSGHIDDLYGPEGINQMCISIYGDPLTKIIEEHPFPKGFQYEVYNEPRPWDNILPGGRLIKSQDPMTVSIIRKTINCYTEMPWVRIQKRNNYSLS